MSETIVIAEIVKGAVHPTTSELITAAHALGSQPTVIVPCADASVADGAAQFSGAAKVIAAKSDVFSNYDAAGWAAALDAVAPAGVLLTSASPQSKDLAARLAARRGISVVQDVVKIEGGNLTSPIYSGKAMQTVAISGNAVISVRANVFSAASSAAANVSVVDQSGDVSTAVQEIMASDTPCLVWDVKEWNDMGEEWATPATSIPYWSEECGEFFYKYSELGDTFSKFIGKNYNPQMFVKRELSLKASLNKFMEIIV